MREKTQQERWESKIKKGPGCWEWIGSKTRNGYGQFHFNGRSTTAIRVSVILSGREIPKDGERMAVDHLCKNRGCVNPDHLVATTDEINCSKERSAGNHGDASAAHAATRARAALITHCPHGHEYTPENTWRYRGVRSCRECSRLRSLRDGRARREKRRLGWCGHSGEMTA